MYTLCSLPYGFRFKTLTIQQARENFEVFVSRITERIVALEELIRTELPAWRADLSEQSLALLGQWFADHVEERIISPQEREELHKRMEPLGALADVHPGLTDVTLSLGVDMGIYLGECVRARCPGAAWKLNRRSKEPVVTGPDLKEDYYAVIQASLGHYVIRTRRRAALEGKPAKAPGTLAEQLAAIDLSVPDKNPRTMLRDILIRVQKYPERNW